MAKNESTAINELIHRTATMTPLRPDPADDLLFRAPPPPLRPPASLAKQPAPPAPPALGDGEGEERIVPLPRTRAAHGTPVDTLPMQGLGASPALPRPPARPPARRPTGSVTMQGLGSVERKAAAALPPASPSPSPSVEDGWAAEPLAGRPPVAAPARSRRTAGSAAQAQASQSMAAQPAQPLHQAAARSPMPVTALLESAAMPAFGHAKPGSLTTGHAAAIVALDAPVRAPIHAPIRAPVEQAPERREQAQHRAEWGETLYVQRSGWKATARKLVVPLVTITVLGVTAGGYFAFYAEGGPRRASRASSAPVAASAAPARQAPAASPASPTAAAAPAAPASPAPAQRPAAHASVPAPASASFIEVMIVSSPTGATVSLVDRDRTLLIGTTPISTALDPSRTYELLFSHPGRATWIEPLDPSQTRRVNVSLGPAAKSALAPASARPAGRPAAAPAGEGILMISSKPPCEIIVDGKPTGLTTPQREISLPAGPHKITLVNKAEHIDKTISVQITAEQPTKVIQDLMK